MAAYKHFRIAPCSSRSSFDLLKLKFVTALIRTGKPQGVASRATNLEKAEKLLGWRPKVDYKEGFEKTINWYFATKNKEEIKSRLERLQTER